jgi:hypothetical protein
MKASGGAPALRIPIRGIFLCCCALTEAPSVTTKTISMHTPILIFMVSSFSSPRIRGHTDLVDTPPLEMK